MNPALVPGCPVRHRRWVTVTMTVACVAALAVAVVWPSWWTAVVVAVVFYSAAYHPGCRFVNRRYARRHRD